MTRTVDVGAGRIVTDVHELYRAKETASVAHSRDRRIELIIRNGEICRYEMRIVG